MDINENRQKSEDLEEVKIQRWLEVNSETIERLLAEAEEKERSRAGTGKRQCIRRSAAFKAAAIQMATATGASNSRVSRIFHINESTLREWRKQQCPLDFQKYSQDEWEVAWTLLDMAGMDQQCQTHQTCQEWYVPSPILSKKRKRCQMQEV